MKTKYKHIHFFQGGSGLWWVNANKDNLTLGVISYYEPWKQHVFSAVDDTMIFSASCLLDIVDFIKQLEAKPNEPDTREHEGGC